MARTFPPPPPRLARLRRRDRLAELRVLDRVARAAFELDARARNAKTFEQAQRVVGFRGASADQAAVAAAEDQARFWVSAGKLGEDGDALARIGERRLAMGG